MPRLGVIILAAGRSIRFAGGGAHKLLVPIQGVPVVRRSVRAAIEADVGDVVVITGAEARAVESALEGLGARCIHEPGFADGMATSLRCGVEALRGSADAVMIGLGDQPGVRPEAYRRLADRWRDTGASIVIPRYAGSTSPAHPALFAAHTFDELLALRGDIGARAVIARDPARVADEVLEWPAPHDVDSPEDLALIVAELSAPASDSRFRGPDPTPNMGTGS